MLRKSFLAICACFLAAAVTGAELKVFQNKIQGGEVNVHMLANGVLTVHHLQNQMLAHILPNFTTRAKGTWFSFANAECSPRLTRPDSRTWSYASQIPLNDQQGLLPVKMTVTPTPFNTIDVTTSWQPPETPAQLREAGLFITIQTKNLLNSPLIIDGKTIPVINQSKYGWFEKQSENPQLVLYKGIPGKEFSMIFQGKYNITIATTLNGPTVIRFNTTTNNINYTINIK